MSYNSRFGLMMGAIIFGLYTLSHATSFIIELNNGHEVTTSRVWEEGDEIKFSIYQGYVGVPRALVKRIRTSAPINNDKVARSAIPQNPTTTDKLPENISQENTDFHHQEGNINSEGERKQDRNISQESDDLISDHEKKVWLTNELEKAINRYHEASGASDLDAKKAALKDMRTYRKKIFKLSEEVKNKNEGKLPNWWNE